LPVRAKRIKPIIGLTGGIGAGKSSVARILHSLGGAVATAYALSFPDDVSGLVLIAPTTHPWEGGSPGIIRSRPRP